MKRGDIWLVSGGVYASKPRPALILQDDRYAATDSLTVCPMTTTALDAPLLRVPIHPSAHSGLRELSWLMVDKITTVRRSNIGVRVGALSAAELTEAERLILVFLGFAG